MSAKRPKSAASSNPIPTKWAVGLIAALIVYALLQPVVNRQFGWQLPSLTALQKGDAPAPKHKEAAGPPAQESAKNANAEQHQPAQADASDPVSDSGEPDVDAVVPSQSTSPPKKTTTPKVLSHTSLRPNSSPSKPPPSKSTSPSKTNSSQASVSAKSTESLRYGILRETAPDDFLSPGGLRYTRGSAEGHRLKHIERHLTDDPGRPGKHGVFDGDMGQAIRWIDEAYDLVQRGAKGTKKQEEGGRTVYEDSFAKPIGFIGGRDGRRDNNPDARRLRLVVEGNKVITAFPF